MESGKSSGGPGGPSVRAIPDGDTHERLICPDCGFVNYENPKIVVGAVALREHRILLCRRAISPRKGYWTLPAGYLELHESPVEGARREAWEEARATLEMRGLLGVYSIPRLSQVQLIYLADLVNGAVSAGEESLEVALFAWDDIPWDDIAFPSVRWALTHYSELGDATEFIPRGNPPGEFGQME
jgi:ADP-ribose pyrophosphatase YjhB (NUDIX family)